MGVNVRNFDIRNGTEHDFAKIRAAVYDHKVVVLKAQQANTAEFNDLSNRFGEPVPYLQSNYHHPDYPLIFVSSNVQKDGKDIGVARTGGYWHSDTAFLDEPIPLTMLYPQVIPEKTERTTLFIDLEKAYEALPSQLRKDLETRHLVHSGRWKYKVRKEDAGLDMSEILAMIDQVQPPVRHPAIITHPVTGRKSIYATRGFTIGVEGCGQERSDTLLDQLLDHIEQTQFISEFSWERGDLIVWDNRFLAHKAGRQSNHPTTDQSAEHEEETMVFRIILRDGYPLCA